MLQAIDGFPSVNGFVPADSFTDATAKRLFGNKCGHDPKNFRFAQLPDFRPRPQVLSNAVGLVRHAVLMVFKGKFFETLLYRLGDTFQRRIMRSCRREAVGAILEYFFNYVDLVTLRISKACDPCGYVPISFKEIQRGTGLSKARLSRALFDLHEAKYMTTTRRWRYDEFGDAKGAIAIRTMSKKLFYDLGISPKKLDEAQKYKRDQQEAIQIKQHTYSKITTQALQIINKNINERRTGLQSVGKLIGQPSATANPLAQNEITRLRIINYPQLSPLQVMELYLRQYPKSEYPNMDLLDFLKLPKGNSS